MDRTINPGPLCRYKHSVAAVAYCITAKTRFGRTYTVGLSNDGRPYCILLRSPQDLCLLGTLALFVVPVTNGGHNVNYIYSITKTIYRIIYGPAYYLSSDMN